MGENFVEHLHSNLCFGTNWDHHKFHLHSVDMPVLILLRSNTGLERTRSKESAAALEGVQAQYIEDITRWREDMNFIF